MSRSLDGQHFDAVIIGAGMSGLAAGIRLAHFGKKVLILERHNAPGGLNSFYSIGGRKFDVGLHALTNFVRPGVKGTALGKLLKQLRIRREELQLCEQKGSRVTFPSESLGFGNDFEYLESEVARAFPGEVDNFRKLVAAIPSLNDPALYTRNESARGVLEHMIGDPQLIEMLLCPIMYYGSATENDLEFGQFAILFRSIFLEGFARPRDGIRPIIRLLLDKYRSLGGVRKMKCGVKQIHTRGDKVHSLELDSGECITGEHIISSAGLVETMRMCEDQPADAEAESEGKLSFVETISVLDCQPKDFGWEDTITFFSTTDKLHYQQAEDPVDLRSGTICFPNNYDYGDAGELPEGVFRVTALADFDAWTSTGDSEYRAMKEAYFQKVTDMALSVLPSVPGGTLEQHTIFTDMFTPRTLKRFTGHVGGAIYGSTKKIRSGATHLDNLYLCGTDQGLLGITGALLSGITVANTHILAP